MECESPDAPPRPRLCGFKRIFVPAGESKNVSIPLDRLTDTVVNESGERVHTEHMTFHIGMSQPDKASVRMSGVQPVMLKL